MFVTGSPFHPSLILGAYPQSGVLLGSSLAHSCQTRLEVAATEKRTSLVRYGINFCRIECYSTGP